MDVGVVGAGWSGLAAATFLRERGHAVRVYEAASRVGGRVATLRVDGCLVELGPHGIVAASDASRRLLSLADVPMVEAPPRAPRLVAHEGRVEPLPLSPPALLRSPLLRARDKARLLAEPTRRAGPPDESVGDLLARRLGAGAGHLADAFVTGIYAGDPTRLVARHAFPRLKEMDASGGLLRGLRRAGPRPPLAAPREGMQALVDALVARLDVRRSEPVARVDAAGVVASASGESRHDLVLVAAEPAVAARLLGVKAAPPPVAPVTIAAFAVPDARCRARGYGVLVPEREGRFILGCLFESELFPGRAPPGRALLRCLVGGRRHPERCGLPEAEVADRAWADLRALGLVEGEPDLVAVHATAGIPQPEAGHDAWLAALPRGRVRVLGIGHRGVGLDALAADTQDALQDL